MTTLTLNAYPATKDGHFLSIEITRRLVSETAEVRTAADCTAALDAFVAKHTAALTAERGVQFSAFIRDRDGRKPNGYKALKLERFVAAGGAL